MAGYDFKEIYHQILDEVKNQNYAKAIEDACGLVFLAESDNDLKFVMMGKYLLGICYYYSYMYQKAIDKLSEVLDLSLEFKEEIEGHLKGDFFDKVRYCLALAMYQHGDLEGSNIVLNHILMKGESSPKIADAVILLGVLYMGMYELTEELEYIIIASRINQVLLEEEILSDGQESMVYNNQAILLIYQEEFDKAQEMLNKCFMLSRAEEEYASLFNETVRIHIQKDNLSKSKKISKKAEKYLDNCQNPFEKSYYFYLLGLLKKEDEDYISALRMFEKSYCIEERCNHLIGKLRVCKELSLLNQILEADNDLLYKDELDKLNDDIKPIREVIKFDTFWKNIKKRLLSE